MVEVSEGHSFFSTLELPGVPLAKGHHTKKPQSHREGPEEPSHSQRATLLEVCCPVPAVSKEALGKSATRSVTVAHAGPGKPAG